MSDLPKFLQITIWVLTILMAFNLIIYVHELGHFLAAKWRGLQIDRFQIWFGKPIWKKTINGVQYGFGWLPFGGFVALPQMAPMEAIEGGEKPEKPLPPISPLDKIIVAFAGPLFSMLLALLAAVVVWQVGKPKDFVDNQVIGYVDEGSPAEKAGLRVGDKIIAINGKTVNGFAGSLDSIQESIILSRGQKIRFTVERPGQSGTLTMESGFETGKTQWFQRRALREVGIDNAGPVIVGGVSPNSPAQKAGLKEGDRILSVDGIELISPAQFSHYVREQGEKSVRIILETKDGVKREIAIKPVKPLKPKDEKPMVGIAFDTSGEVDTRLVKPAPFEQVTDSLRQMWVTITTVLAPDSNIGADHLSGPIGIAKVQYRMLQMDDGWRRILAFFVLFNVNLAVLNMMPFPVLDGGHITLAVLEALRGRPVKSKPLEILQTICALLLISLMLFVSSKDIGDSFGQGGGKSKEIVFPKD